MKFDYSDYDEFCNGFMQKEAIHYMEYIYGTYSLDMFLNALALILEKKGKFDDVIEFLITKDRMKKDGIVKKKMKKVMEEFKGGKLHSGSKKGPEVTSRAQAVAIGLSEARKKGATVPKKGKK